MSATCLIALLRVIGCISLLAIVPALMPLSWMAAVHQRLGLGPLPQGPIVEYLARSLSAMYAILGGLMLLAAGDLNRHAPLIRYLALVSIALGAMVFVVALRVGLRWHWTASEGPVTVALGAAILLLQRSARSGRSAAEKD